MPFSFSPQIAVPRDAMEARRRQTQTRASATVGRRRVAAESWDEKQVRAWVANLHPSFKKYGNAFVDSAVNGALLLTLQESDLETMGIDNALHRKRIVVAIDELKHADEL